MPAISNRNHPPDNAHFCCYLHKHGYVYVEWRYEGSYRRIKAHILVWEHFRGPLPAGYVVHHIDGDRLNNDIENLQAMTASEHAILHCELRGHKTLAERKTYRVRYRTENRDVLRAKGRQYYAANKERRRDYQKARYKHIQEGDPETYAATLIHNRDYLRTWRERRKTRINPVLIRESH